MPEAETLKDVYIEEMRDLWSANDQMRRVVQEMSNQASDATLKDLLSKSVSGIAAHTGKLKSVLQARGGNVGTEHCKGLEGLVAEAKKHAMDADMDGELRDLVMISQYQRMSHYGLAGFGTAASYAKALGFQDDAAQLNAIVKDIYKADEFASHLAERAEKAVA
jgi:ferritin-like metal-binding protein YciE